MKVKRRTGEGSLELIALVVAIILGIAFGVFYGQEMWLASGGAKKKLVELQTVEEQKQAIIVAETTKAEQLTEEIRSLQSEENPNEDEINAKQSEKEKSLAEAKRITDDHLPKINAEAERLTLVAEEAEKATKEGTNAFAYYSYILSDFAGDIFIQILKMLVIPLVVTSMICGMTSLGDIRKLGRIGGITITYYLTTGAVAVLIGIVLVQVIQPGGQPVDDTFAFINENVASKQGATISETILNVFRGRGDPSSGMFPANLFAAASATNVLALITFSIVFGGALTTLGAKGKPAIDFFNSINEAIMQIVKLVMFFAPVGIFGLVASNIANTGGAEAFYEEMERIGRYAMTVMLGLGIHFFVLASLIALLARQNPITYTLGVLRAMLTAVSTASSSATLPITMECVEENNNVSPRTSSFVLPLGATVNMDGTALYEAVAVIFIAQSLGIDLTGAELLIVFLTVTLAAVGAAGIPGAGLVTMVIVLQAVDLPTEKIGMILAIDWFLDRLRTTINVYGDAVGAGVVDRLTRNERANGVT